MMALYFIASKCKSTPNSLNGYHYVNDVKDIIFKEEEIKINIEQVLTQNDYNNSISPQCSKGFVKNKSIGSHISPTSNKSNSGRLSDSKIYDTTKKLGIKNMHVTNSQSPNKPNLPKPLKTKTDLRYKTGNSPATINHRSTPTNLDSHKSITPSHLSGILKMKRCEFK